MKSEPGGNTMLTRVQAAKYLGCSISYLNNLACNDPQRLPFVKIGRFVKYKQCDLDSYIFNKSIGSR